jgi:glycosyltransferase involved in cell wall biosynthesis
MSLGVPVLAASKSAIPEIVGDSACLVNPESVDDMADGLKKIVLDSDYRQLLIESGHRQITKFSWKKAAAGYMNIYKEAITL